MSDFRFDCLFSSSFVSPLLLLLPRLAQNPPDFQ